jgi:hypothetical protein
MIDAMAHTLPRDLRTDPDIAADVADILDAALAWSRDELPLNALMQIGTIEDHRGNPSPRYSRWVAMCTAKTGDIRKLALLDALQIVVAAQGIITQCGFITQDDLMESDANVRRAGLAKDPWERTAA